MKVAQVTKTFFVRFTGEWQHMSAPTTEHDVVAPNIESLTVDIPPDTEKIQFFERQKVTMDDGTSFVAEVPLSPEYALEEAEEGSWGNPRGV